ncbi:MAG: adenylyl-sulfate kinase [Clostridia bacterium]
MHGLLKFITCGSVDDGKSTLIGHMLYDAKLIFTDQENALKLDSKVGSRGAKIDYSLLLDGLMAEREQGITIDVAYRYFNTDKRSFIVADTPGHEEYTRNMAVGASFADLSIILVDAMQGILTQTKRHARICALMGIEHFVFAINKMDLMEYNFDVYKKISLDIERLMGEIPFKTITIIPVSATEGDNVSKKYDNMPWYNGQTLLEYLEEIDISKENENEDFVLPIQRVSRPNLNFRGFQGQVSQGSVKVSDEITVLPSGETAKIKSLLMTDCEVDEISKGEAVTVVLDREVDCSRGCVITNKKQMSVSRLFRCDLLWMDEDELVVGRNHLIKIGTKTVPATIIKIHHCVDVNSGQHVPMKQAKKNDIVNCDISLSSKVVLSDFENCQDLGRFLLINRVTNATSACGVISHSLYRSDNLTWQNTEITREIRAGQKGQAPKTIWFTGLSGSGKSTIANILEKNLFSQGKHTMLLDGDNIRMGLNNNLGFTQEDRVENIRRIAETCKLMNDAGLIVLVSVISPFAADRQNARQIIGDTFFEVHVNTSLEECERRDTKNLYKKARKGEIANFTGISSPYEVPTHAEFVADTQKFDAEQLAEQILQKI